ncbi:HD-GYP domain-containing protein [Pleomorphomonas carboxyditropha]|nr:HD domain-containing phosphohydrolase [Pleomorphomonas carboxyditropha]
MPARICLVHDDVSEQERPYLFALSIHCPVVQCHWREREKLAHRVAMPWLIDVKRLNAEAAEALRPFTIPPLLGFRLVAVDGDQPALSDRTAGWWGPTIAVPRPIEATTVLRLAGLCRPEQDVPARREPSTLSSDRPPGVPPALSKPLPPSAHSLIGEAIHDAATILDLVFRSFDGKQRIASDDWHAAVPVIIDMISEKGLRLWLDRVREHHVGTYQHSLLVMGIAAELGRVLGLMESNVEQLALGGLLHDVGKFEVPQTILDKPGQLSSEELAVLRRHPRDGWAALLSTIPSLDPAILDLVLHHHEQLDGGGYPDGLPGDRISPMVRMLTVSDVLGALLERRPYRPPLPRREALEIMRAMADSGKLDPAFVRAVADLDIEPIVDRSMDLLRNRDRR